ncbi:MAG TPA: hypothetical protein VNY84_00045 [Acidimicrobiales bacterium]|nr:hypothetical protein [Acidimicrobiales bacterium]
MTVAALSLHVPDEPTAHADVWLNAVADGASIESVLTGDDGVADWLWQRWSSLSKVGISRDAFDGIVVEYRRELWLWLAGERTWAQACSGLVGRISRRIGQVDSTSA